MFLCGKNQTMRSYWKTNLKYLFILVGIGFICCFVFPILMVDSLNQIKIGGFPLGFWFALQGSIISCVVLLFVYARLMNKLDKKYGLED